MNKKTKILTGIIAIAIVICTIIAVYGIITAPKSDRQVLKEELANNEKTLEDDLSTYTPDPDDYEEADTENNTIDNNTTDNNTIDNKDNDANSGKTKVNHKITVIGDSVFLGASPEFKKLHKKAVIDAKVSRQVAQGLDVAKALDEKNKLGDTIIISLGTNGNFNEKTGQELIDYFGDDRTIYWINVYGKDLPVQKEVNKTIDALVEKNDNVHLIPWADEGADHSDWFYQDGIHLNSEGQKGFAAYVESQINATEAASEKQ